MKRQAIVFTGPGKAELVEEELAAPQAGEVLVRLVRSCISSGTARANVTGAALDQALDAVAPYARLALLGCTRNSNFSIDYYHKVHGRGVTIVGAHTLARCELESVPGWWTERDDALAFLRLLSLGRISLAGFTDEVHAPADCGAVFARLAAGGPFPNVQFGWK